MHFSVSCTDDPTVRCFYGRAVICVNVFSSQITRDQWINCKTISPGREKPMQTLGGCRFFFKGLLCFRSPPRQLLTRAPVWGFQSRCAASCLQNNFDCETINDSPSHIFRRESFWMMYLSSELFSMCAYSIWQEDVNQWDFNFGAFWNIYSAALVCGVLVLSESRGVSNVEFGWENILLCIERRPLVSQIRPPINIALMCDSPF